MNKKIIIGARGSKLSLSYAEKVKHLLSFVTKKTEIEIQTIAGRVAYIKSNL